MKKLTLFLATLILLSTSTFSNKQNISDKLIKKERNNISYVSTYSDNERSLGIIVIVAVSGVTIMGAYLAMNKERNNKK